MHPFFLEKKIPFGQKAKLVEKAEPLVLSEL